MTDAAPMIHPLSDVQTDRIGRGTRVYICREASIGAGAVILPGLRIGHGALVAAGAVATRDVADHTVVAGVPARVMQNVRG